MTCSRSFDPWYVSNNRWFLGINGAIWIKKDRDEEDWAGLVIEFWSGMKQGLDGYPQRALGSFG